jgi:phosphatidate phosphatase APP1
VRSSRSDGKLIGVVRRVLLLALFVGLLISMRRARAEKIPFVDLYTSHGRPERFALSGRAIQVHRGQLEESGRGSFRSLVHNVRRFAPTEFEDRVVRLSVFDLVMEAHTDREGLFRLDVESPKKPLPPGFVPVTASVLDLEGKPMEPSSTGVVQVIGRNAKYALVSDIDDTILVSHVLHRRKLLWNTFGRGVDAMQPVTGMAQVYRDLSAMGPDRPGVFYLSGSPVDLHRKLSIFLDRNGFPPGSLILKNLGVRSLVPQRLQTWRPFAWLDPADSLTGTLDYKTRHIQQLMDDLPELKFILVGDSGEKDPEIYGQFARDAKLGKRVAAVYIRNASGEKPDDARFRGQMLFDDPADLRQDLVKRRILPAGLLK